MFLTNLEKYQITLASQSPRRKQLLELMQIPFVIEVKNVDESFPPHLKSEKVVLYLSEKKASVYEINSDSNLLIITADTIVVLNDEIIGKPADHNDALKMLQKLSGKMHEVFTGVCLKTKSKKETFFCRSEVYFRNISAEEIEYYVTTFKPFDKAGAYGIQDWFGLTGIEKINGSFYNVMGLPTKELFEHLINF